MQARSTAFPFPIESGRILTFARSVGDMRPVYTDQLSAPAGAPMVVPPTFVAAAHLFDPSMVVPLGAVTTAAGTTGGRADTVHAEHEVEFLTTLHAGDVLQVRRRPGRCWVRTGSTGPLEFQEQVTEFHTAAAVAVRVRKVSVRRGPPEAAPRVAQRSLPADQDAMDPRDVVVERVLVDRLTRAHIAQYAGASGDYNLVHVDENFAVTQAGYPSIIAHGMLTMGLSGTLVSTLFRPNGLRHFRGRFLVPVAPGDGLVCRVRVCRRQPAVASVTTHRLADDVVVFRGTASGALQPSVRAALKVTPR